MTATCRRGNAVANRGKPKMALRRLSRAEPRAGCRKRTARQETRRIAMRHDPQCFRPERRGEQANRFSPASRSAERDARKAGPVATRCPRLHQPFTTPRAPKRGGPLGVLRGAFRLYPSLINLLALPFALRNAIGAIIRLRLDLRTGNSRLRSRAWSGAWDELGGGPSGSDSSRPFNHLQGGGNRCVTDGHAKPNAGVARRIVQRRH